MKKVYGIDLGTTYSCISYVDEHCKPVVVPNSENERITPSAVFFDGNNVIVGGEAKANSKLQPNAVVEMVKRSMGDANYLFVHDGKNYRPEEISALILRKLVGDAEKATGEKITDVIITCPAYFGVNQRDATARAGEIAGLNVRSIINEPTAAAIAYGLDREKDQVVLVYDLGGGTFDITMIEIKDGPITVLCTGGDHNLGGKDWDSNIVKYLAEQFKEQIGSNEDILEDSETLQDLFLNAERAKKSLSVRDKAPISITHSGQKAKVELTREKFDELTAPLLERTIILTKQMLEEAKVKGNIHYDKILLVGGSTRMPQVSKRLKEEFKIECESYDPDESVAKGAAIYGWKLAIDEEIKTAIASNTGQNIDSVNINNISEAEIKKAEKIVGEKFGILPSTVSKAGKTTITNVTSKTFGIVIQDRQTKKERVSNLIFRNDKVPANVTKDFATSEANQSVVAIQLMEGMEINELVELDMCSEIGSAELNLAPGLPEYSPIIVNFILNEQGRMEVTATDPKSKKVKKIVVQTVCVMSEDEVERAKTRGMALVVS
ncbi:MAG: Hsp70 family protein [Candidatus Staskawiczbacteria bacterium]|nr:Hsp70 family protein [Candidatus Staskawiczbacteria bacterium]